MPTIIEALPDENPYPGLNLEEAGRPVDIRRIVNNLLLGQMNNVLEFTVTEGMVLPITVRDGRIQPNSWIGLSSASDNPRWRVSAQRVEECDIMWTGTAGWSTRPLRMVVIG
jgi:hypothetical protein